MGASANGVMLLMHRDID